MKPLLMIRGITTHLETSDAFSYTSSGEERMNILALLTAKPSVSLDRFGPLMLPEEQTVWKHYAAGTLRLMNFQPDPLCVLLYFEAPGKTTVRALLDTFPMVEADLFDIVLIEAGPWIPFRVLFAPEALPTASA